MRRRHGLQSLRRNAQNRTPKKKIYIFSEGANTEPHYLFAVAKQSLNSNVVEIVIEEGAGAPSTLLKLAKSTKKKIKKNGMSKSDEIWIVFDRDEHGCFYETINNARDLGINCAYSHPCFEFWLVLHYQDHNSPMSHHDMQKKLSELSATYDRKAGKKFNFAEVAENIPVAVERAERGRVQRDLEGSVIGNPSTTVDRLVLSIRPDLLSKSA